MSAAHENRLQIELGAAKGRLILCFFESSRVAQKFEKSVRKATKRRKKHHNTWAGGPLAEDGALGSAPARDHILDS